MKTLEKCYIFKRWHVIEVGISAIRSRHKGEIFAYHSQADISYKGKKNAKKIHPATADFQLKKKEEKEERIRKKAETYGKEPDPRPAWIWLAIETHD